MENQAYSLVLSTYPGEETAQQFAKRIIEEQLAACVNVLPEMVSIYQWQGKLEQGRECQLLIKTEKTKLEPLFQFIQENHPYELPEIVEVPISSGLPAYLSWISGALNRETS